MLKSFLKSSLIVFLLIFSVNASHRIVKVCLHETKSYPVKEISRIKDSYPGKLKVIKFKKRYFIINEVDLNTYLCGVLSKETGPEWPYEFLKAQAVVSRTYLYWKMNENKEKGLPFDIINHIYNQVYGICKDEKIKNAVKETQDEILTFNGNVAHVFFHACCGGHITIPEHVWTGYYDGYSIVDDPYCKDSPYFKWEKKFTDDYIASVFKMNELKKIEVKEKDPTGRVMKIYLTDKQGNTLEITGHRFRITLNEKVKKITFNNPFVLPSTLFEIEKEGKYYIFKGRGYGHGIGFCQWGARKMAENGKTYREILKFFFPLMEIKKEAP